MPTQLIQPLLENPMLALFAIIGLGLLIGNIEISGISLGSSGVIFIALIAGHLGCTVPGQIGNIGLALFVYCVGIGAGGRFFASMKKEGRQLAILALAIAIAGGGATWVLAHFLNINAGLATGIFAGSLTSTPALAAAIEAAGAFSNDVVVGYGVAYPFGVVGVVLFVQLLPRLLRLRIDDSKDEAPEASILRRLVEVNNPNLIGQPFTTASLASIGGCQISRVLRNDRMEPVTFSDTFEEGQVLLLVGDAKAMNIATHLIGRPIERKMFLDIENERQRLVLTNRKLVGKTIEEIDPLQNHGVVITRVERMEFHFAPRPETILGKNDVLTVVGAPEHLKLFETFLGHRAQAYFETSLVSLTIGLALGIIIGNLEAPLPGGGTFSLGLSGGPLLVALILGHFGRVGGIVGYIPRPTRILLQEMGLVFFLADAGTRGGATIMNAVQTQGVQIFILGAIVTLIPLAVGYVMARRGFKMKLGQSLGGICGGMTSTPALGAIVAKTAQQAPIVSYATVYPVAVILMAVIAKLLIMVLS